MERNEYHAKDARQHTKRKRTSSGSPIPKRQKKNDQETDKANKYGAREHRNHISYERNWRFRKERKWERDGQSHMGNRLKPETNGVVFNGITDCSQAQNKRKEQPNFQSSGNHKEDSNSHGRAICKHNEPPEARKHKKR